MKVSRFSFVPIIFPAVFVSFSGSAQALTKANNATALNAAGSWVEATAPVGTDVLLFDGTGVPGALSVAVGASATVGGSVQFTTIAGNVTITQSNGQTWTLGNGGIDMSAATADVTIGASGRFFRWANANYGGISVAAGRTLDINSAFSNQGNTKTLTLTGPGNINFNNTAGSGTMRFSVTGGANVTMNGAGGWGSGSGSNVNEVINGTLNIGHDTALSAITLNLGGANANTPTITASGAARTIANNVTLLASDLGGSATIGGTNNLTINGTVTNSGGNRTLTVNNTGLTTLGGTVNLSNDATNRTLTINGTGNATISGAIVNGGTATASGFTYSGGGTLLLGNTSTYTGATIVSAGTLLVNGALGNTATAVNGSATLGGTGTIGGSVTVAATAFLAAGDNGIESLGVASAVINGSLLTQFNGTGGGTIDLLVATGNLDIANATLDLSMIGGGSALDDASYIFATYGSLTGSAFSSVLNLPAGYEIDYAFGGNNIALVAVPEPTGILLGSLGLLAFFRRRRS